MRNASTCHVSRQSVDDWPEPGPHCSCGCTRTLRINSGRLTVQHGRQIGRNGEYAYEVLARYTCGSCPCVYESVAHALHSVQEAVRRLPRRWTHPVKAQQRVARLRPRQTQNHNHAPRPGDWDEV